MASLAADSSQLKGLTVHHRKPLTALPECIGKLVKLERLAVIGASLAVLPSGFGRLTSLQVRGDSNLSPAF